MANCRGCNAPIMWAITEDGKRAPLDSHPSASGNVLVWRSAVIHDSANRPQTMGGEVRCATFAGETLATLVAHGVPLRTNHFMTCAVADRFKPQTEMAT